MLNNDGRDKLVSPRLSAHRYPIGTSGDESSSGKQPTRGPSGRGADDAASLKKLAKQAGEAARLLKLLGNEKRLLILCFLAVRGEMTVGELVDVAKLSQSALSQHLAQLRADGLVEFRRASQTLHYRVVDQSALRVLQLLKEIYCGDLK